MPESSSFARYLLIGAAVLAVIGLVLWRVLPVPMPVPPFVFTALLAAGYGGYEWWRIRSRGGRP
jgi:hypothetical protein